MLNKLKNTYTTFEKKLGQIHKILTLYSIYITKNIF